MSTKGQKADDEFSTHRPHVTAKSVVITRTTGGGRSRQSMGGGGGYSSSFSSRASFGGLNPQIYSKLTSSGIADFRSHRESEKREMQDLNERLASYIEKVRFLEAKIKQYEAELEALRNRKQEDWKPIRDMYESELDQARKVISELSTQKGVSEARLAGLQDEIQSLKEMMALIDGQKKDLQKQLDAANTQIGEFEGELATLRLRCGTLEDENVKLRDIIAKLKDDNARLRADLDAETAAHIEQEVEAQAKSEECEFLKDLLEKLELMKEQPVTIGGQNLEAFYKGEMKKAVREIQQAYDDTIATMSVEMENKYAAQMNQLRSGSVRENMEVEHVKEENKRLRDQLGEAKRRIAELESLLGSLRAERDNLRVELQETQTELDRERTEKARMVSELQMQIETLMAQLNELIDAKMSLELEIACYKKLLEGEENRTGLRQLVEQTVGVRGGGAGNLADIIGSSSMSSTTARTVVQRSSKGPIVLQDLDPAGGFLSVENTGAPGRGKTQSLKGWKIVKTVNEDRKFTVDLPDVDLTPGKRFVIFAKGKKDKATSPDEMVCGEFSLGTGTSKFTLYDEKNAEKASINTKTVNA